MLESGNRYLALQLFHLPLHTRHFRDRRALISSLVRSSFDLLRKRCRPISKRACAKRVLLPPSRMSAFSFPRRWILSLTISPVFRETRGGRERSVISMKNSNHSNDSPRFWPRSSRLSIPKLKYLWIFLIDLFYLKYSFHEVWRLIW